MLENQISRLGKDQASNKKILFLINTLKLGGGAQTVATILGKNLMNLGYEVTYLIFFPLKPFIQIDLPIYSLNEKHGGWTNKQEGRKKSLLRRIKRLFELTLIFPKVVRHFCEKNEIEIIISFLEDANLVSISSRVLYGNKPKLIISLRSNPNSYQKKFSVLIYKKLLIKRFYKYSDFVVIPSKGIKKVLINMGISSNRLKTIYNPTDVEKNLLLSEIDLNFDAIKDSFVFISIGRFERIKGHLFLIKAFYNVIKNFNNVHLILIGDGHLKLEILRYIQILKIEDYVSILGIKKNIFPYLKIADCLILPSITEAFPNILIEALSVNLPIISTDCESGPREILTDSVKLDTNLEYPYLGQYGILTRPFSINQEPRLEFPLSKSEKSLSDAMKLIIKSPELIERYSKVIIKAKKFDKNKIVNDWIDLISLFNNGSV